MNPLEFIRLFTSHNPTHKLVPIIPTIPFDPTQKIATIQAHRTIIESYGCPKCNNVNLKVDALEEANKGWEAKVHCSRCKTKLSVNDEGFHVDFIEETE